MAADARRRAACHQCIRQWGAEYGTGLSPTGGWTDDCPHVKQIVADAVGQAVRELRSEMGVEFDDERIGYVTVQINRNAWEALNGR